MSERAGGNWGGGGGGALELVRQDVCPGLALVADPTRTAAFDKQIWTARHGAKPSTWSKTWLSWSWVVTWAIACDVVDLLLPMFFFSTLKALLTWVFMCVGSSFSMLQALRHGPVVATVHQSSMAIFGRGGCTLYLS